MISQVNSPCPCPSPLSLEKKAHKAWFSHVPRIAISLPSRATTPPSPYPSQKAHDRQSASQLAYSFGACSRIITSHHIVVIADKPNLPMQPIHVARVPTNISPLQTRLISDLFFFPFVCFTRILPLYPQLCIHFCMSSAYPCHPRMPDSECKGKGNKTKQNKEKEERGSPKRITLEKNSRNAHTCIIFPHLTPLTPLIHLNHQPPSKPCLKLRRQECKLCTVA